MIQASSTQIFGLERGGFSVSPYDLAKITDTISSIGLIEHEGRGIATGFVTEAQGRRLLVSARHCFAEDTSRSAINNPLVDRYVKFPRGVRFLADVRRAYIAPPRLVGEDLVVIPLDQEINVKPLPLSRISPGEIGLTDRQVACYGYFLNDDFPAISFGRIQDINYSRHDFEIDAVAGPGSSGGPVLNTQHEVIGMVYSEGIRAYLTSFLHSYPHIS